MEKMVSKVRAKKTKTREKQAGKAASCPTPLRHHAAIRAAVALLLWLAALLVLHSDELLSPDPTVEFIMSLAGEGAFLLVSLFVVGLFLSVTDRKLLNNNAKISLMAVIVLISLIVGKSLLYFSDVSGLTFFSDLQPFLLPFVIAPLLATILMNGVAGIATGVWVSLALGVAVGWDLPAFLTGLIATVLTSHLARNVRKRSKVVRIGLLVGVTEITCVFGLTALHWAAADTRLVLWQAAACLFSGVASAILILLLLPLFEATFRITTDITLLELSDLGHPLLQRLAIEAPGTYHHSLVVANLAQAAAEEIGANPLLARVASYFHDVGKLTKPNFFAENIQRRTNPHDDLPPSMSTLVITAHVKEGISLGLLHKLPRPIMAVISEHHGTSLLSFFHHKATTQLEFELGKQDTGPSNGQSKVDESAFRYSGPKPSSRESAIICMADGVEAASRSMEKTTPGHIESLVTEIVGRKLHDGQLDGCDMTLSELRRVKASFVFTLTNMLHGRIPYPKDENRDKQQSNATPGEQVDTKKSGHLRHGEGRQAGQGSAVG